MFANNLPLSLSSIDGVGEAQRAASGPALGSWLAAALLVIFSLPFLLHRAIGEDRILQVELAGYSDYAARVRWRLLPGVW
jgi:protein-S-isoprenylcysteine O-methyltransferase Ste14